MAAKNQSLLLAVKSLTNAHRDALVCKYLKATEVIELVLPSQTVRFSPLKKMNDPRETEGGRFKCEAFTGEETPPDSFDMERRFGENLRNLASVFCATRDDSEDRQVMMRRGFGKPRMWAQYGDNHSGACLVFDRSVLRDAAQAALSTEQRLWVGNVSYDRNMLGAGAGAFCFDYKKYKADQFNYLVSHADQWQLSLFFRKHEDWQGESEWRMATIANKQGGCCVQYGAALKYVVVGHRVHADTLRRIKELFDGPVLRLRYEQWREDCVLSIAEDPC